ncbi:MAG: cellulase family glycosylhydrolase [Caldilineaceae bacterium]
MSRLKLMLALLILSVAALTVLGAVAGLGRLIAYFNSGADPASIFQAIPTVPVDLNDRVTWLPDQAADAQGRRLDPYMREQIAGAYLYGWAQWSISYELNRPYNLKTYFAPPALDAVTLSVTSTVAAGWQVRQSNLHHTLQLTFYGDDGALVAFTDHNAHLVQQVLNSDGSLVDVRESTNVYDVVMRLEDGAWRIRDLVRRGDGPPLTAVGALPPDTAPSRAEFVQVQGNQLLLHGEPFMIAGINYYPQASPWTKFWPEYKSTQTIEDLDLIQQLGLNTIRIFISYVDFGADEVQPTEIAKLTHFLDQAHTRHLKVIVTIFDHHTDHHVSTWAADDRHLAGLIPHFADHPAILAWDIKNEPNRDYEFNTQALVDAWLRHIARTVRRYDPNHLITIGWSQPEAAAALTDIVDFVSFHYFEELADYSTRLEGLLAAADGKPVVLQEFVMSTWNSFWPHGHTEAEQARYYADLLRQHRAYPTAGYMVWTLHDFDSVPLSEFGTPWQRATQANMGLMRRDGSWKPAAAVITPGASLDLPPLPPWHRWTKPFWLMVMTMGMLGLVLCLLLFWWWRRRAAPKGSR